MSKFTECIKSIGNKVAALFSPHQYRLAQIAEYHDNNIEISKEFQEDYAEKLPMKIRKKCRKAVHNNSFDPYGFYAEWDSIDDECEHEKLRLYRQYTDGKSRHEVQNAAARTRLHEIQYELAAAQAQLDILYEKLLYSQTVYRQRPVTEDNSTDVPSEYKDGTSAYD